MHKEIRVRCVVGPCEPALVFLILDQLGVTAEAARQMALSKPLEHRAAVKTATTLES
jgi:hypothetical protein